MLENEIDLHIGKTTVAKMQLIKAAMNSTKEWVSWLDELFDMLLQENKQTSTQILENIFEIL